MFSKGPPELVVVNDFYDDPMAVRGEALAQEFVESAYHKGKRTRRQFLYPGLKERFEDLLGRKITVWSEHAHNGTFQICLPGDPLVYHSDEQHYAGAVYLSPGAPLESGTAFWRSRELGLDRVPPLEVAHAMGFKDSDALVRKMYGNRLLDRTAWEKIDQVGNVFNRLALWNGWRVHSADGYFGHSIETGRLFQIFFFDVEGV